MDKTFLRYFLRLAYLACLGSHLVTPIIATAQSDDYYQHLASINGDAGPNSYTNGLGYRQMSIHSGTNGTQFNIKIAGLTNGQSYILKLIKATETGAWLQPANNSEFPFTATSSPIRGFIIDSNQTVRFRIDSVVTTYDISSTERTYSVELWHAGQMVDNASIEIKFDDSTGDYVHNATPTLQGINLYNTEIYLQPGGYPEDNRPNKTGDYGNPPETPPLLSRSQFLNTSGTDQEVAVFVDGVRISDWYNVKDGQTGTFDFTIPADIVANTDENTVLEFRNKNGDTFNIESEPHSFEIVDEFGNFSTQEGTKLSGHASVTTNSVVETVNTGSNSNGSYEVLRITNTDQNNNVTNQYHIRNLGDDNTNIFTSNDTGGNSETTNQTNNDGATENQSDDVTESEQDAIKELSAELGALDADAELAETTESLQESADERESGLANVLGGFFQSLNFGGPGMGQSSTMVVSIPTIGQITIDAGVQWVSWIRNALLAVLSACFVWKSIELFKI